MESFSFVTVSRGRLNHIKQTLPHMVAQGASNLIVVDYGCPDATGDWVESSYPGVKVLRVEDDSPFCVARGRNLGANLADSDWIVFIDADILSVPGWHKWMQDNVEVGKFYRQSPIEGKRCLETWGTCIISRSDFENVGGYDEIFRGWGGEDTDIYERLILNGSKECFFPGEFISAIKHGDDLRAGWYGLRNIKEAEALTKCYSLAKSAVMEQFNFKGDLPLEYRYYLMMDLRLTLRDWFNNGGSQTFSIKTRIMHNDELLNIIINSEGI